MPLFSSCFASERKHRLSKSTVSVVLAIAAVFSSTSFAASVAESGIEFLRAENYYKRHAEGWYWYRDPEKEVEEEVKLPQLPNETAKPEKEKIAEANQATPEPAVEYAPVPLSAKWVRDMLPRYRDIMWSDPTPENVKAYFLLQRFAIDRSQKVAEVAQQVTLGNPLLDETFRRPTASFGINAVDRSAGQNTDALLKKIAERAGIFFFFKSDCRFCEAEAPLVGMLERDSGFDVLAISIDGGVLENQRFANTRVDAGHAAQLGVTATPALFLVSGDGRFESLGQGLMALPDLRRRIIVAAARQGWITESEFEDTKPIINPESQIDLSKELPQLLLAAQKPAFAWGDPQAADFVAEHPEEASKVAQQDGFIAPANLIALFDGAGTDGRFDPNILSAESHEEDIQP